MTHEAARAARPEEAAGMPVDQDVCTGSPANTPARRGQRPVLQLVSKSLRFSLDAKTQALRTVSLFSFPENLNQVL